LHVEVHTLKVETEFEKNFSKQRLTNIFTENVSLSNASGIDNLNPRKLFPKIHDEINIILHKVPKGSYKFTKYKLKLVTKGRNKIPRELSIPSVRDRIVLRALSEFLKDRFEPSLNLKLPQVIIKNVKKDLKSGLFNAYIKLDVRDFYPSIEHDQLLRRIRKRIRYPYILNLIQLALQTPTVSVSKSADKLSERGVPQGLSISNILANIYLLNIDKHLNSRTDISYYRYVDDILILCDESDITKITRDVIKQFKRLGLEVYDPLEPQEHKGKSSIGKISDSFKYLGYVFKDSKISIREESINKLKSSLASIFTSHKYADAKIRRKEFLEWRVNLRITGCIFQERSKGWLHFFSEINDEQLLHTLDHFVKILMKRFDVDIESKKFVRTYYDLKYRRRETNYIPNFDKFTLEQKKHTLAHHFGLDLGKYRSDKEIEYEFRKRIDKQVRDLEEDIGSISWH
jgi:hypothetical protein